MLLELRLESLATVESLTWEPGPGLNVVSGETGAGKSVLVGAVALLFGGRAGAEVVRTGAAAARVEGRFDWSTVKDLASLLGDLPLDDPSDVVLRREISADGRSRSHLNGRALSLGQAREFGRRLFDMHSQHEHQGLLRPETHLELLDRGGGHHSELLAEATEAAALERVRESLRRFEEGLRDEASRRDLWAYQLKELTDAALTSGEDLELERERLRLAHAERLVEAMDEAAGHLDDDETGALTRLGAARRALTRAVPWDETLLPLLEMVDEAEARAGEAARELASRAASLEADPARLAEIEDRLQTLIRIRKRYGGGLDEAIALREDLSFKLSALDHPEETEERLKMDLSRARGRWLEARRALHASRLKAASALSRALAKEWREVGLPGARFEVFLEGEPPGPEFGAWPHRAEFLISANPGEELRPLAKVASGGEVSRVMLGLKSVFVEEESFTTLLFDEVDAGIGGRVAEVVAEKLRKLSRRRQVLCITHLPAIAARADRHFSVEKSVKAGRTYTRVVPLGPEGRIEELGRMLAGSRITEATRAQARELLGLPEAPG